MDILMSVSIKKRLTAILLIWSIAFLGSVVFAIVRMIDLSNITETMCINDMNVSNMAIKARADIFKMERDLKELLIIKNKGQIQDIISNIRSIDQSIANNFDEINKKTKIQESLRLSCQAKEIFYQWRLEKKNAEDLILEGQVEQASEIIQEVTPQYVKQLEEILIKIEQNSKDNANELRNRTKNIVANQNLIFIAVVIISGIISVLLFVIISNSILKPINTLKKAVDESTATGNLSFVEISGKNEIVDMTNNYNILVSKLRDIFWIKDTQNKLSQELSGCKSIDQLTQKALNYTAEVVGAGKGLLYLFDKEANMLYMRSAYAFSQQDKLYEKINVGEGIIGQVALQKKSILLNGMNKDESCISTGIYDGIPLNTYAMPLIYENELYGVMSLASFEHFDKIKLEALNECSSIIAVNLYSAIQTQKMVDLLEISEKATREAQNSAEELRFINIKLQQQQELLQHQAEELRKTNRQLEEQQQKLEEQARVLNMKNNQLEETSKELEKRSMELETINRYKSQFLANVSHEFRTSLNSIILLSKLLLNKSKGKLIDSDKEKIAIINKAGQELLHLINGILDLSKIEEGKMTVNVQEVESADLINDIRQMFEGIAKEKNLHFSVEDLVNNKLRGDIQKISQILRNLVSNAIKFTDYGFVNIKAVEDESNLNSVIFTVRDTGIGISPEQQSIIFDEFQQGDGSISWKYGGTGLGLSISKKLAEMLNGEIRVESQVGKGSEFSLIIPNLIESKKHSCCIRTFVQIEQEEVTVLSNIDT